MKEKKDSFLCLGCIKKFKEKSFFFITFEVDENVEEVFASLAPFKCKIVKLFALLTLYSIIDVDK